MVHQIRKRHEATTEEYLKKIEQSWNGVREKTHKCLEKKKKKSDISCPKYFQGQLQCLFHFSCIYYSRLSHLIFRFVIKNSFFLYVKILLLTRLYVFPPQCQVI